MLSRISFRRPKLALAGILIAIGGCAESPSSPATPPQFLVRGAQARFSVSGSGSATAVIDQRGGTLTSAAGDRITFPEGALSTPTTVTLTSDGTYVGVELQPHGTTFPAGREPELILNTGSSGQRGSIVYVNDAGAVTEVLRTEASGGKLEASLHHFSKYYAVGG